MVNILELLTLLGTNAAIVGAVAWLGREVSKQFFSKDLEKFKLNLEKESLRYRIRYERLHTERAEVIKELYKRLSRAHDSMSTLTCPGQFAGEPSIEEKAKTAEGAVNGLISYYEENKIFLEENLSEEFDRLIGHFKSAWREFQTSQELRGSEEPGSAERWYKAWEKVSKEEVPEVRKRIEDKFRGIIGIGDD